jgi:hypothetical protein
MRRVFVWALLIAACGAIFLLSPPAISRAAFGISPPFLNTDHLVPGVTYKQTIYLVQDQPNTDLGIHAALTVPDAIKSWFSIDKGFDFVIPAGTRQFPVVVSVAVPKDAGLGKYSGNLVFTTEPTTGGQVAIALAANVAINLTVGNNIYESYKVDAITLPDIEEGWNPRATVRFENDGNIPESFDTATFDLYDQFDAVRLAYVTKQSGFPTTPPFTTDEYTIEFPTDFHLGVGDYWGNVTFYKDNQVVGTVRTIFHVLPAGSLSPLNKTLAFVESTWYYWVIGAFLLFFIIRRLMVHSRRRKTRARAHAE